MQNVLADRYASPAMQAIWDEKGKVLSEREFWIAVLKAQDKLGLNMPKGCIEAYEKVKQNINIDAIRQREQVLRHDVKARIEEFCDLAGYQEIHKGLTSRDLTDNVEQLQIKKSLQIIESKGKAILFQWQKKAAQWKTLAIAARTHNVPAQMTTLGKRLAMFGEVFFRSQKQLARFIEEYPLRGIKGAAGTLLDQSVLFDHDSQKVMQLENEIKKHLGFSRVLQNVGQVYPRLLDAEVVQILVNLASAISGFCKTLRLMAGQELMTEGFKQGQVGSSAMPHKMNTRNAERVNGLYLILTGYQTMAQGLAGDQWNEGDVSCSVVRRVMLPDSFFALDGLYETFLTLMLEMGTFDAVIENEVRKYFPFLSTTKLLMLAVQSGMGREKAHQKIKEASLATLADLRSGKIVTNDLWQRLMNDPEFSVDSKQIQQLKTEGMEEFLGQAEEQTLSFVSEVKEYLSAYPEEITYVPGALL